MNFSVFQPAPKLCDLGAQHTPHLLLCHAKTHLGFSKSFLNFLYVGAYAGANRKFDGCVGLWLLGLAVGGKGPAAGGLQLENPWGRGSPRQGCGSFTISINSSRSGLLL